jgi:hypothetical protein
VHPRDVLGRLLGYAPARIDTLLTSGAERQA